jgi:hypothetical protein
VFVVLLLSPYSAQSCIKTSKNSIFNSFSIVIKHAYNKISHFNNFYMYSVVALGAFTLM